MSEKKTYTKQDIISVLSEKGVSIDWTEIITVFNTFVELAKDKPVVVAGIGKFFIQKTKPRGSKADLKVDYVPRFKLKTSPQVNDLLLNEIVGGARFKGAQETVKAVVGGTGRPNPFKK